MPPDFADAPEIALDDPRAGVRIATNTPTVLAVATRYARATAVAVDGRFAPGERVTLRATAGTAWQMVPAKDKHGRVLTDNHGRPRLVQGETRPATAAELRQLRWRVHPGGVLLVDQRPGASGDAVTLTLPARLLGETVVACAYNYQPTVNTHLHWPVEDAAAPGGRRAGQGGLLTDPAQLAATMGEDVEPGGEVSARIEAVFPHLVRLFPKYGPTTTLRQAHFLAQVRHETLGLTLLREQISDAQAGRDYGDKNGNEGPADGAAFKGRGLLHTTGYDGYRAYFGNARHEDLPRAELRRRAPDLERAADAAEAGLYFWNTKRCSERADADDALGVSIRVNGWLERDFLPRHYAQRVAYLQHAKRVLGLRR